MTAISDFDIFARVGQTGNLSAAGHKMRPSPAIVTRDETLLEERLAAQLFQRRIRRLTVIETGEGYSKRAVDITSLVEEAEDFVSWRNTTARGQLKNSAPTCFSRLRIAPYLAGFCAK